MFTVVDLFSGCGGLSWGFREEGFQVLAGADLKKAALKTFARNFPEARTLDVDLSNYPPDGLGIRPGELDCLIGGPPCQGFSKNVPARLRYLEDPRNRLMRRFLEYVQYLRPLVVLIENVAEMMNAYGEAYTNEILETLGSIGYDAKNERILAANYGVPQLRRRTFFFANRLSVPVVFPESSHVAPNSKPTIFNWKGARTHVTVWEAISDLPRLEAGKGENACEYATEPQSDYQCLMRSGSAVVYDHVARALTKTQLERVNHLQPGKGGGVEALPLHLRPRSGYSGAYGRLRPDEPARTITRWVFHPGSGRYYHPYDNRVITIREAARLQSFPDCFAFEGSYVQKSDQVGEAVPPMLARAFAKQAKLVLLAGEQAVLGNKIS